MNFTKSIEICFNKFANFEGRARKSEFWWFTLFYFVALFTAVIRRAHDVGKSGWFMLIPIYNFVLSVSRSQQGPNEWGDPRPHTINKGLESNSEENLTD